MRSNPQGELSDNGMYRLRNNKELDPLGFLTPRSRDGEWYSDKPVNWQPYNVYYDNPYLDAVWDEDSGGWLVTEKDAFQHYPIFLPSTGIDTLTGRYNASKATLAILKHDAGLPPHLRPLHRTGYTDAKFAELIRAEEAALSRTGSQLWQRQREDIRKDALARLREKEAAETRRQAEARQRLFEEQQQALADQTQQINELRAEQDAQQEQLGRERLATQAGVRSLNILSSLGSEGSTAPTAALTGGPFQQRGSKRRPAPQSLRIGSSRQAPSVGLNIGL